MGIGTASDLHFGGDARRRGGTHCCEGSYVFVCIASCERARICMGGWFGWEILYGSAEERGAEENCMGGGPECPFYYGPADCEGEGGV